MATLITGLDVGSSQIKGVVVEVGKDGMLSVLSVFREPSEGFRRGVLADADEAGAKIRALAVDLQKISKKATQNVFVNINSEQVKAKVSKGVAAVSRADREIQQEDLDRVTQASRAVKLMSNSIVLHNIVKEYFVDDVGDIRDPLGMTGSRLEVSTMIVEGFMPQVNPLVKVLERAGIGIGGLIFNPLAAARAVLTKKQRELGVVMVDFGAGTTTVAVYEEGKVLHIKSVPLGSAYVTNDIAIGLKVSVETAEKLKTAYGSALAGDIGRKETVALSEIDPRLEGEVSRRFLAEIIEVRLAEILDCVNNELKLVGRDVQLPAGVVITGGGVKMAGMAELVKRELRLSVQIGFPDLGEFDVMNPTHKEMLDDPEFAVAVGLALWGNAENKEMSAGLGAVKGFFKNFLP